MGALFYGLIAVSKEWRGPMRPTVNIDLSPLVLPKYVFFSLTRGFAAYGLSLLFTLIYGYIAAYNKKAEKVLVPLLDILQSIPVLGFLPGLILALVAFFPASNIGLELAAVVMIFTGQVWNMTFSFYNSLKSIPTDLLEASRVYKFNWWQRFIKVQLAYSTMGLVWNSMMSMAGGWFFLTITEAFVLGNKDFRLPGIGSYMSVAIAQGNFPAMIYAIIAMVLMIALVDQLFWKPIVAWAQKYKFEETEAAEVSQSFVLDILRRSQLVKFIRTRIFEPATSKFSVQLLSGSVALEAAESSPIGKPLFTFFRWILIGIFVLFLLWGLEKTLILFSTINLLEWLSILYNLLLTFIRVLVAVGIGTILMVPLGVAIGMNPKLSRILQPIVQIVASFPAPMLFPIVIAVLAKLGVGIGIGAIALMMLGTQWYILFNIIAGAMGIPHDLLEAAYVARLSRVQRWKKLILPAIFPSLITGWVTASGGAWNASIVAEYVHYGDKFLIATGLGSTITQATDAGNYGILTASVFAMATTVVLINRTFWKRMYHIATNRYSLNK